MERLYHIVCIVEKTKEKIYMTKYPMTHKECCTMKSKITTYSWRRIELEDATFTL